MTDILSIESICNSVMTISGVDKRNMALLAFLLHMILIAESKTMAATQDEIAKGNFLAHCPLFDGIANAIMESLHGDNVDQLSIRTGMTGRLPAADDLRVPQQGSRNTGHPGFHRRSVPPAAS